MLRLNEKMRSNKVLYLRGIDILKKKIRINKEITVKKHLAFQRLNIRDLLQEIAIPVCVRCPINSKGPNPKITIRAQRECIHGKLSFISDLGGKSWVESEYINVFRCEAQVSKYQQQKDPQKMTSFIAIVKTAKYYQEIA